MIMKNVEHKILDVIYNCGGITKFGIEKLGGDNEIIKTLLEKKIIRKQPIELNNKKIALYTVTENGERYYADKTGKKQFFRCTRHEKIIKLSYFYISNIENIEKWINKDEWYNRGESGSVPDGTFFSQDMFFGVMVVKEEDRGNIKDKLQNFIEEHEIDQIKLIAY